MELTGRWPWQANTADAMEDAAARLAAFGREPRRSLDAIAVFRSLSRAAESMAAAASELRRQEWSGLDDEENPEAAAAWAGALEGLRAVRDTDTLSGTSLPRRASAGDRNRRTEDHRAARRARHSRRRGG